MNQIQLQNIIDVIQQIIDLLYQENLKPAYMLLGSVLPQLESVIISIENQDIQNNIVEKMAEALNAMEEEDSTLLADLLQYELLEQLKELL